MAPARWIFVDLGLPGIVESTCDLLQDDVNLHKAPPCWLRAGEFHPQANGSAQPPTPWACDCSLVA